MKKRTILFATHAKEQCGVYQFGKRVFNALKEESIKRNSPYHFCQTECKEPDDLISAIGRVNPSAIIYNWHPSTLGFANDEFLSHYSQVKHFAIAHECEVPSLMNAIILPDPTAIDSGKKFHTGRLLASYQTHAAPSACPVIGSFGFGFMDKGYGPLCQRVQKEFDEAIIRLHVPFAYYGDEGGRVAVAHVETARRFISKPGIQVEVSHGFLGDAELFKWLAANDVNAFFYERMARRGISSTIDYALSVRRPIAVTNSHMFRHILDDETRTKICVDHISLKEIIANGVAPLEKFYARWTPENLLRDYEEILAKVL